VFGAYAAPGLSIGVPALAATFDLPAAIVPGPMGRALGALGAGVLLVLFAATALALREVLGRALRRPKDESDAPGPRAEHTRPIMRVCLVAACVASLWGGEASRALLTGLGLAASATLGARLADDEPATRLDRRRGRVRRLRAARAAAPDLGECDRHVSRAGRGAPRVGREPGVGGFGFAPLTRRLGRVATDEARRIMRRHG